MQHKKEKIMIHFVFLSSTASLKLKYFLVLSWKCKVHSIRAYYCRCVCWNCNTCFMKSLPTFWSLFSWLHWHYTNYDTFTVVQNYAYDTRDNVEVDGLSKWVEAIKFISWSHENKEPTITGSLLEQRKLVSTTKNILTVNWIKILDSRNSHKKSDALKGWLFSYSIDRRGHH
jgi:hypothetical protein